VARRIDDVNRALIPLAREGTPIVRDEIRPFVRAARPVVRDLRQPVPGLVRVSTTLARSLGSLNSLVNLIGFNKDGREDPGDPDRDEGYAFWTAWLAHNGLAVFSTADSTGIFRPVAIQANCQTLNSTIAEEPQIEFLQGLTGALTDSRVCPDQSGNVIDPRKRSADKKTPSAKAALTKKGAG
jgi:phospholipid/cholesterol/gamma-HCH transport system substrate-binding protein